MFPPEAMMGGMPEGMPPPPEAMGPPPQESPQGIEEILNNMLDMADAYRQQEDDQQNLLAIEQVRTLIQKILANEQKQADDLLQGKASPQAIRRYGG